MLCFEACPDTVNQPNSEPDRPSTGVPTAELWKTDFLVESFEKITDQGVEISVLFSQLVHLPNRVDHCRMVLSAKASPYFRQRGVSQRLAQIHRNLPRFRDRLRIV